MSPEGFPKRREACNGSLYKRVAARRGHHQKKAIIAVAREMLSIIWYMLSRKEVYRGSDRIEGLRG
ncbi:MAG: hypothetical protein QXI39_04265 [Candidatus Bathyarchaeia archaeon]